MSTDKDAIVNLEHFLTPFSQKIGVFEYTKDSNCVLQCIENVNQQINNEHWNLNNATLFAIDVKALYPSVKLPLLRNALIGSFKKWTDWTDTTITILVGIIMYTLENNRLFGMSSTIYQTKVFPRGQNTVYRWRIYF